MSAVQQTSNISPMTNREMAYIQIQLDQVMQQIEQMQKLGEKPTKSLIQKKNDLQSEIAVLLEGLEA